MRSVSLWKIKPTESAATDAIHHLHNALEPISYDHASQQIARFLMHYPRRHTEQDAVVIQDLADEFRIRNFGIVPVIQTLKAIRNKHTHDNPWVPQTGEILDRIQDEQNRLREQLDRLTQPERPQIEQKSHDKGEKMIWDAMDEKQRSDAVAMLKTLNSDLGKIYAGFIEMPDVEYRKLQEKDVK